MGRNTSRVVASVTSAARNGYVPFQHVEEDSIAKKKSYRGRTPINHEKLRKRYQIWVDYVELIQASGGEPVDEARIAKQAALSSENTDHSALRVGVPIPSLATTKDLFRWLVHGSKGILAKHMTVDSLLANSEWFFATFEKMTHSTFDEDYRKATTYWIRNALLEEGLVTNQHKPKYLFGEDELIRFNVTFWTVDEAQFTHPRSKVQISWVTAVFTWTGARIGAFFPTPDKPRATLRYGLLFDDTSYLLALAFADNAIYGIKTPQELWQLNIPEGENELILRWNEGIPELPIVRKITAAGVTTEPLQMETFRKIFKSVIEASGYLGNPTIHSIRRFWGKKVDRRHTAVQTAQHLGPADERVYGRSYVANTSSVDGRSAFLNEPARSDHIDYFQSFARFRESGLPQQLPAERVAGVQQDPHVIKLTKDLQLLRSSKANLLKVQSAERELRSSRKRLLKKSKIDFQQEWIRERRDWKVLTRGLEKPIDNTSTDLLDMLSKIWPFRARLTRTMTSAVVVSNEERRQAVEDLYFLATQ